MNGSEAVRQAEEHRDDRAELQDSVPVVAGEVVSERLMVPCDPIDGALVAAREWLALPLRNAAVVRSRDDWREVPGHMVATGRMIGQRRVALRLPHASRPEPYGWPNYVDIRTKDLDGEEDGSALRGCGRRS